MEEKNVCPGCEKHCDLSAPSCGKGREFSTVRENDFFQREGATCFCSCKECVDKYKKYYHSDAFAYRSARMKDSYEDVVFVDDDKIEKLHEEYCSRR